MSWPCFAFTPFINFFTTSIQAHHSSLIFSRYPEGTCGIRSCSLQEGSVMHLKNKSSLLFILMLFMFVSACRNGGDAAVNSNETAQPPSQEHSAEQPESGETIGPPSSTEIKTVVFSTFFHSDYFI